MKEVGHQSQKYICANISSYQKSHYSTTIHCTPRTADLRNWKENVNIVFIRAKEMCLQMQPRQTVWGLEHMIVQVCFLLLKLLLGALLQGTPYWLSPWSPEGWELFISPTLDNTGRSPSGVKSEVFFFTVAYQYLCFLTKCISVLNLF